MTRSLGAVEALNNHRCRAQEEQNATEFLAAENALVTLAERFPGRVLLEFPHPLTPL